jgi:hypothetical protein
MAEIKIITIPIDQCICEGKVRKPRRNCWALGHNLGAIKVQITNATGLVETWRLP